MIAFRRGALRNAALLPLVSTVGDTANGVAPLPSKTFTRNSSNTGWSHTFLRLYDYITSAGAIVLSWRTKKRRPGRAFGQEDIRLVSRRLDACVGDASGSVPSYRTTDASTLDVRREEISIVVFPDTARRLTGSGTATGAGPGAAVAASAAAAAWR